MEKTSIKVPLDSTLLVEPTSIMGACPGAWGDWARMAKPAKVGKND